VTRTGQGTHRASRISLEAFERVDGAGEFTETRPISWLYDSEALIWPQFTQIDNYDSLIVEIKFPVQLGPNLEEAARNT
jgi:hypothetical protein